MKGVARGDATELYRVDAACWIGRSALQRGRDSSSDAVVAAAAAAARLARAAAGELDAREQEAAREQVEPSRLRGNLYGGPHARRAGVGAVPPPRRRSWEIAVAFGRRGAWSGQRTSKAA